MESVKGATNDANEFERNWLAPRSFKFKRLWALFRGDRYLIKLIESAVKKWKFHFKVKKSEEN